MFLGRLSSHTIKDDRNFTFSPVTYSRFKFGCLRSSEIIGKELANTFIHLDGIHGIINHDRPVVVAASAYRTVPVASVQLKDAFVRHLNRYLAEYSIPPVQEVKVDRDGTHPKDYGKLSAEERKSLIGKDVFKVDERLLDGKLVLFLDDVYITGTHEAIAQRMVDKCISTTSVNFDYMYLYYAMTTGNVDCRVEDTLNMYDINSLDRLGAMIDKGDYVVTVRMTKFILRSDPLDVESFLRSRDRQFIGEFKNAALSERYYKVPEYRKNIQTLNTISHELRSSQTISA